ncbi:MAG TPA: hypothetical protein VEA36_01130 [Candidatus Paceibacterota bacterium]|nr:hypothetical protein [Candidatus Paceibacterota bacterium]
MSYLIAIIVSLILLVGFLTLTAFEASHGVRILGGVRRRLDRKVGQASFILSHVDLGSFVRDSIRDGIERVLHDIAHTSLLLVRFIERVLTRFVRQLRGRKEELPERPRRTFREAVQHVRRTVRLRRISIQEKQEGGE